MDRLEGGSAFRGTAAPVVIKTAVGRAALLSAAACPACMPQLLSTLMLGSACTWEISSMAGALLGGSPAAESVALATVWCLVPTLWQSTCQGMECSRNMRCRKKAAASNVRTSLVASAALCNSNWTRSCYVRGSDTTVSLVLRQSRKARHRS